MDHSFRVLGVFVVGCGDIGCRVAALEQAQGLEVAALARTPESAGKLEALGILPLAGDLDQPESLQHLRVDAQLLYYFAPPPGSGNGDPRLAALLRTLEKTGLPKRLVYISTTGVYGDCQGQWVDETRPCHPQSQRAQRRVAAEEALREFSERLGLHYSILRVPGIYGPARLPLQRLRRGVPLIRLEECPMGNRIHAADLARVCVAAARQAGQGAIYNAGDGHPLPVTEYFRRIADALGWPRPPEISMDEARKVLDPGMLSFLEESKRLDNTKMLRELLLTLEFEDLNLGIQDCLRTLSREESSW
jgi:nucleoside-diphosphate-sugar epimerase